MQHHLTVRHRAAGFQKAHVFGGNIRIAGKVELAEATPLSPLPDQLTDGRRRICHNKNITRFAE
jgi:hypothetical protein